MVASLPITAGTLHRRHNIVALLKACAKQKDLQKGSQIHDDIIKWGLFLKDCYVGSSLINMYSKCGALDKAAQVLRELPMKDVITWNALIAGYAEQGQGEDAIRCYEQMQFEGLSANLVTYICILKACGKVGATDKGKQIHEEIVWRGLLEDIVLGSTLVDMYAKCGVFEKAAELLDTLPSRNVVSWSILISGYAQHGRGQEAIKCFERMQQEGILPNAATFLGLLQACGSIGVIEMGEWIHTEVVRQGLLDRDCNIGNALVDMYAKWGVVSRAEQVLDELPYRNTVSWNALITGYSYQIQDEAALQCFMRMESEGLSPDRVTFISLLKACCSIEAIKVIHEHITRHGLLCKDVVIGNTLVDMYIKCGAIAKAARVLDELPVRDVITWNTLIAGFAQQGQDEDVLNCFDSMQCEGHFPDIVSYICILRACGRRGEAEKGNQLHDKLIRQRLLGKDIVLGNSLVDMYNKCGELVKATETFDELPFRNAVSWNVLISGYAQQGQGKEALACFAHMQHEGLSPDKVTFICMLKACGSLEDVDTGEQIHNRILRYGLFHGDAALGNTLVDMYAKCGAFGKAARVLHDLPVQDIVSWNAFIGGYVEMGYLEEALECFEWMQSEGHSPDTVTFISVLQACCNVRAVDKGEHIHNEVLRQGLLGKDMVLGNILVDMYAKCGALSKAAQVLDGLCLRNVVSWNSLCAGYDQQGKGMDALNCFEQMQREGLSPDTVTFICILQACGSMGAIGRGKQIHDQIAERGWLGKDIVLDTSLVDMYAKCGALAQARQVFDGLPNTNVACWNALIAGYAQQGQGEEALICFQCMQHESLSPDTITLVCVLNACSCSGLLDKGKAFFTDMRAKYDISPDMGHYSCMVELFGHLGEFETALSVMNTMPSFDLAVFRGLLSSCQKCGNLELGRLAFRRAVNLLKMMQYSSHD